MIVQVLAKKNDEHCFTTQGHAHAEAAARMVLQS
jgi:hypothetical protein